MKRNLFIIISLVCGITFASCKDFQEVSNYYKGARKGMTNTVTKDKRQSKDNVRETLKLSNFNGIDVSDVIIVNYKQGNKYDVEIVGTRERIDRLDIYVDKGILHIVAKHNLINKTNNDNEKPVINITSPHLKMIDISGVCDFNAGDFNSDNFKLDCSGVSNFNVGNIKCKTFDLDTSGVGNIKCNVEAKDVKLDCSGVNSSQMNINADRLTLDMSGSGKMNAKFKGKYVNIDVSGVGNININVDCEKLEAQSSGVSKCKISGTADKTTIDSSGVSKIDTKELNNF